MMIRIEPQDNYEQQLTRIILGGLRVLVITDMLDAFIDALAFETDEELGYLLKMYQHPETRCTMLDKTNLAI